VTTVWAIVPGEGAPIFFALCRQHGREIRNREEKLLAAAGCRLDVVRNSLSIVKLRREAGGSRHLRDCIRCGRERGIVATYVEGPVNLDELLAGASA
jgi:hypothetical protein